MPDKCRFLITFDVNPDNIPKFENLLTSVQADLPKVEGCLNVDIFRHEGPAANRFTLLETWASKSLHQAHVARMQDSGQWANIEEMLAEPPAGHYLLAF